ncbi:MAG: hypothetical protein K2Q10_08050 [Rhodospirillales bacterium]|nr:hypothetical protein [Rhodospirillales bacterium]
MLRLILLFICLVGAVPAEAAQTKSLSQRIHRLDPRIQPSLKVNARDTRPLLVPLRQRPAWLKQAVKALAKEKKGTRLAVKTTVMLRGGQGPGWLAVIWGGKGVSPLLEIHKLGKDRLERVLTEPGDVLRFVEPTGQDVDGDGIPKLFVAQTHPGNAAIGQGLRIFKLGETAREVTPQAEGRLVRAVQTARLDGVTVVIASDDEWYNFFASCGECGPFIPLVYRWRDGAYVPACRDVPAYFDKHVRWLEDSLPRENSAAGRLETHMEQALTYLQAGWWQAGQRVFAETLTLVAAGRLVPEDRANLAGKWAEAMRNDIGPAVSQASAHAASACPLLETPPPTTMEYSDRLQSFGEALQ